MNQSRLLRWARNAVDVGLIAALAWAGYSLAMSKSESPTDSPPPPGLAASAQAMLGQTLSPIEVFAPGDSRRTVSLDSATAATLVMVFRSDCRFCEQSASEWRRLVDSVGTGVQVIAVNTEDPRTALRWVTRHAIRLTDLWVPANLREYSVRWGVTAVPLTLVVDRSARVTYAHLGVVTADQVDSVASRLLAARQGNSGG